MIKKNMTIIRDYFSLVDFKNKYLIIFIIVCIINILASLFIPYFISMIVETLTAKSYYKAIIYVLLLGLSYIFNKCNSYCTNWCYANFFKMTYVDLHRALVNSIYNFDAEFSKKLPIGKIINSSNMDIVNISELPSLSIEMFIEIAKLIVIYIILAIKSPLIALYVLVIDAIYFRFATEYTDKGTHYLKKQIDYADKMTALVSQILIGIKDIKSFGIGERLNNKLDSYRKRWQTNYFLKRKYYFTRKTLMSLMIDMGKIVLYLILVMYLIKGRIVISIFLLLISYYENSKETINSILNFNTSILEESVSLYRIMDVINYKGNSDTVFGNLEKDDITGYVEFKNVSFSYSSLPTLKNITFSARPNEITVIAGKTGSGKTSIFNLLMRMYKVDKGKISIDGIDIYDYSKKVYNSNITVVNQKTFIFNMSIRENLALVEPNKKRQIDACKRCYIHDFIMSLPKGYNTVLKEDATNISGGQKQLLSLARSLLTSSEIILLDEFTSSLDPDTSKKIVELLYDLKTDHTIIIITHNKDIMKIADKLVVLHDGQIASIGQHKDLIKSSETYRTLQNK